MKFTEEYVMCIEKQVFSEKSVYKWVKYGFATTSLSGKDTLTL